MKLYAGIFAKPPEKVVLHRIKDSWSRENFSLTNSSPVNSKEIYEKLKELENKAELFHDNPISIEARFLPPKE